MASQTRTPGVWSPICDINPHSQARLGDSPSLSPRPPTVKCEVEPLPLKIGRFGARQGRMSHRHTASARHKSVEVAAGRLITFPDSIHPAGCLGAAQQRQQLEAPVPWALRHHFDATVREVARPSPYPEFQCSRPGPPAKAHALYPAPHHCHESHRGITGSRHKRERTDRPTPDHTRHDRVGCGATSPCGATPALTVMPRPVPLPRV